MENHFSPEDIKASVEYQWRKQCAQAHLLLYALILIVYFFITLFTSVTESIDLSSLGSILGIGLIIFGLCVSPLLIGAILDYRKMRYLLRQYPQFRAYEVVLDKVSTSYRRRSVYYTVTIDDDGTRRQVETSPCFSSFSQFSCEEYNNRKVVGLYDPHNNKFYIIRRIH